MSVKKDKLPLLVKFSVAQTTGDKNVSVYGDWRVIYRTNKSVASAYLHEPYGTEERFDLTILLDANPITKQINEKSVFLIDEYPTDMNVKGNYRIKKIFPEYLGVIRIGLESIEGNSFKSLYYLDGDKILSYQLNYDSSTNIGYIDKYANHPFSSSTKIWLTEPVDKDDELDMLSFVSERNVGIIDNLKVFKALTFREENGNQ